MIRNIIFDWSGTLVDDLPAVLNATNHVFAQCGVPEMSLDQFRSEFCLPFTLFYQKHTPGLSLDDLETWFHHRFREMQHLVTELPHARAFLEFCRANGLRLFVLSTVHPDHYAAQATITGFGNYMERAYVGVQDKRTRIHDVLAENGLAADQTLFIGDMQHDIETARHAGIRSCAVLTGYNRLDQLRESQPGLIVEHLGELRQILTQTQELLGLAPPSPPVTPTALPVVTVGALIFNPAGEVLMLRTQKWSGLWGIPGGKIRYAESSVSALARELKEETNLDIEDIQFVLVQDCIGSREFYREAHFVLLNYTCRCTEGQTVILNEEAQEFLWLPLSKALLLKLNQPTRVLLEAVIRCKNETGVSN